MDIVFDYFFEEVFLKMERSGLQSRHKRQSVLEQLNAVISGCSAGQDEEPAEACSQAVLSAIRHHQKSKADNSTICMMGKYHNILYIALKVSWDWGVKDSATIRALLEEIYSCEKTFERLFLGSLFGPNAPYFLAGWRSDFKDRDENSRAMVYYLHHANVECLSFPVYCKSYGCCKPIRFIDVPIESCGNVTPMRVAIQASAPDILLILLRFGASPVPMDDGAPPILAILDKFLEYEDRRYPYQLESCLKLLLRATAFVELPYKPLIYEVRKDMFVKKYHTLLEDNLIQTNRLFGVVELKHLCRCAIRSRLRENFQLPEGIQKLRIPGSLKRYVDLMENDNS